MRLLFLCSFLLAGPAAADVYKWIDASGRTQYSDRQSAGAEHLLIIRQPPSEQAADQPIEGKRPLGPYKSFEIVSPQANETIRSHDRQVQVSLLLEPTLEQGNRIELILDGQPVTGEIKGTQLGLNGLALGTHRLEARITDAQGTIIAASSPIDFHLQRPLPAAP